MQPSYTTLYIGHTYFFQNKLLKCYLPIIHCRILALLLLTKKSYAMEQFNLIANIATLAFFAIWFLVIVFQGIRDAIKK